MSIQSHLKTTIRLAAHTTGLGIFLLMQTASAETSSTTQDINLSIPLVALLDIAEVATQLTFIAPENAGDGFSLVTPLNDVVPVAVSSNNPNAKLDVKIDQDLASNGLGLEITETSGTLGSCTTTIPTQVDQTLCSVGMKQSTSGSLTIAPHTGTTMPAYGDYSVTVTYTLTQN